jgi:Chemoreceptor zinc-binding domain
MATMRDEIKKAIGHHGRWLNDLLHAIGGGRTRLAAEDAGREDACAFGQWLLTSEDARGSPEFSTIRALHAKFHEEAAKVVGLALQGRGAEAQAATDSRSAYMKASSELMRAMIEWCERS